MSIPATEINGGSVPDAPALDHGDTNPDLLVGDEVPANDVEHDLDLDAFDDPEDDGVGDDDPDPEPLTETDIAELLGETR